MSAPPVALTIAGTDSGGAAGTAADLATFAALGVHGACVITAVTAQHTLGVDAVHPIPGAMVAAQLEAVLGDLPVAAVKTGMLGSAETVQRVAARCAGMPLVVDPVLVATSGAVLGGREVRDAYLEHLLPVATVITPNLQEACALLDLPARNTQPVTSAQPTPNAQPSQNAQPTPRAQPAASARTAAPDLALALANHGCAVLLTGGPEWHPGDPTDTCTDWLATPDGELRSFRHDAVATTNDHGTGCTFSAALAALLARGLQLAAAAADAAAFTTTQLNRSRTWKLGQGRGPIAHTHEPRSAR